MFVSQELGEDISILELTLLENEIKIKVSSLTGQQLEGGPKEIWGEFPSKAQEVYQTSKLAKFALMLIIGGGVC